MKWKGRKGMLFLLSKNSYIGTSAEFETLTSVQIPASGVVSGDLEDGVYDGYQLQASPVGDEIRPLQFVSKATGMYWVKRIHRMNTGYIYIVEVGDIPDFSDFQ